jgi:pimeloyl-ACP methyl ester carboxylesterase
VTTWPLRELRSAGERGTALLLPGALASDVFFEDVAAEAELEGLRLVATTLPGYAGTSPPADDSVEASAAAACELAGRLGASVVAGHSFGAVVAIEMAASGRYRGALVLISPSFSRRDESIVPRVLDRLSTVFGHLPYTLVLKLIGRMLGGAVPPDRVAPLAAELSRNDPRFLRRNTRTFLRYLDRHGSLVDRLCASGLTTWVVFGAEDDVKLQSEERRALEACPHVTLVTIADTGHFSLNTHPERIAALIAEADSAARYAQVDA